MTAAERALLLDLARRLATMAAGSPATAEIRALIAAVERESQTEQGGVDALGIRADMAAMGMSLARLEAAMAEAIEAIRYPDRPDK